MSVGSQFCDIEVEIEKRLIKGLRIIFEQDPQFVYNNDDRETKVIISPDYPKKDDSFKTPHIVIAGISYSNNMQMTFSNNLFSDYKRSGIDNYAQTRIFQIPFNATAACLGEYDVSRNLANRAFYYINFTAYEYLSNSLMLHLSSCSKGQSSPKEQYPGHIFMTPVSLNGMLTIEDIKGPFNYMQGNRSVPADKLGEAFTEINTSASIEE